MKYRLIYTRRAERDIKKLESNTKERVGKALLRYGEDPLKFAKSSQTQSWVNTGFGLALQDYF